MTDADGTLPTPEMTANSELYGQPQDMKFVTELTNYLINLPKKGETQFSLRCFGR